MVSAVNSRDSWGSTSKILMTCAMCAAWIFAVVSAALVGGTATLPATIITLGIVLIASAFHHFSGNHPQPDRRDAAPGFRTS